MACDKSSAVFLSATFSSSMRRSVKSTSVQYPSYVSHHQGPPPVANICSLFGSIRVLSHASEIPLPRSPSAPSPRRHYRCPPTPPLPSCELHMAPINLDACIEQLLNKQLLHEALLREICEKTKEVLMRESNVVHVSAPVTVVGDIHGYVCGFFQHVLRKHTVRL